MIGPIELTFRQRGQRVVMSMSGDTETLRRIADESEVIEGTTVPKWIELDTSGGAEPDRHVRVELRDGSPVLTELSWKAGPGQGEIRQKHLKQTEIAKLVTDLVVSVMPTTDLVPVDSDLGRIEEAPEVAALRQSKAAARKFVDRQRLARARRVITPELLQEVAKVYRDNINGAPTKAVGEMFNVQPRQASKYVDAARQRGFLPATVRGQKKA
ncbi:hypothetical protein L2K20_29135 [Mycobacterium sp. MBM]|nr:hypothetical protein [Mycobacterium sp. MBM]